MYVSTFRSNMLPPSPGQYSSNLKKQAALFRKTGDLPNYRSYTTEAAAFIPNSPLAPPELHNYTQLTQADIHDGHQTTGLNDPGFPIRQRQEISLFFKTSTVLGSIQPAIRWVKCFFPEGKAARA